MFTAEDVPIPASFSPSSVQAGHKNKEEHVGEHATEVVLASHGVYEEYLAYDCRPPSSSTTERGGDESNAVQDNMKPLGDGREGLSLTTSAKTKHAQNSHDPDSAAAQENADTGLGHQKGKEAGKQIRFFSPQQRELREEMMDRLFDEIWRRITPDLLGAAEKACNSNALRNRGTGDEHGAEM